MLAVRAFSDVTVFNVRNNAQFGSPQFKAAVQLKKTATIESSDLNNSAIMDMAFPLHAATKYPALWLVNDKGAPFQCTVRDGHKTLSDFMSSPYRFIYTYLPFSVHVCYRVRQTMHIAASGGFQKAKKSIWASWHLRNR